MVCWAVEINYRAVEINNWAVKKGFLKQGVAFL